jgi:uncharacterized membrane protein YdjX (TVP38/TMEM64 family)
VWVWMFVSPSSRVHYVKLIFVYQHICVVMMIVIVIIVVVVVVRPSMWMMTMTSLVFGSVVGTRVADQTNSGVETSSTRGTHGTCGC